jgi:hypothetical protein
MKFFNMPEKVPQLEIDKKDVEQKIDKTIGQISRESAWRNKEPVSPTVNEAAMEVERAINAEKIKQGDYEDHWRRQMEDSMMGQLDYLAEESIKEREAKEKSPEERDNKAAA